MRNILFFIMIISLFSCKEQTRELGTSSADSRCHIKIQGRKDFSFSGWHTTLLGSMDDPATVGFKTDFYCKNFDSTDIVLHWTDNRHCKIRINEQDGKIRNFNADFDESSQIHIYEVP